MAGARTPRTRRRESGAARCSRGAGGETRRERGWLRARFSSSRRSAYGVRSNAYDIRTGREVKHGPSVVKTELPPGVAAAWRQRDGASRLPSRGLSLDRVVAAAIKVASVDGL